MDAAFRPPLPPFSKETAAEKVRLAEDGWNSRDAAKIATAYTLDTHWRNRATFITSRDKAERFLRDKWIKEREYRLIKELWAFNMIGRFFWASTSDYIGRKSTYHAFFVLGTVLYLSIPFFASSGGVAALIGFYIATMIIFTMYGGGFATIPAYLADMFGTHHVGGIHGRLLTAWSTAGVLGPFAITYLRNTSRENAITDLVAQIDPAAFVAKFGAPVSQLNELVAAKSVTIAKLMEIAPAGTVDPTPTLYNSTMYCMAGLLVIAFFANLMVRPVNKSHWLETTHPLSTFLGKTAHMERDGVL